MKALRRLRQHAEVVRADVEEQVAKALARGVSEAALVACQLLDAAKAKAEARSGGAKLACTVGCSACCHVHVEVTPPELVAIVEWLRDRKTPLELAELAARLARRASVEKLSNDERWAVRLPCAMLERGRCTIYERRPLRCRAFHSLSRSVCDSAFDGKSDDAPDLDPAVCRATNAVENGYERALARTGLTAPGVLLEGGLLALLKGSS